MITKVGEKAECKITHRLELNYAKRCEDDLASTAQKGVT